MAGFDESRLYSDKPGKVLFFNYINGCRQDVVNLKKKMTDLGWVCEDVNADSLEDLRNISKGKGGYSGTIMVFSLDMDTKINYFWDCRSTRVSRIKYSNKN